MTVLVTVHSVLRWNRCPTIPIMKAIIDELLSLYPECKVVIHQPIWYSPNTYNGAMYLAAGLKRLKSYTPMIHKLVDYYSQANPNQVFWGDTAASDFFRNNYQSYFTAGEEMQVLFICTRIKREPVSWVNTGQRLS